MDEFELFRRLGLAIAIGAAVGVERHWRDRDEREGGRTAGLRTFTLIGMLGGVAGLLEHYLAPQTGVAGIVLAAFFLALTLPMTLFEFREAVADNSYSVTSVIAAMVTFALGAVAVLGDMTVASAGGVVTLAVLASREFLHRSMQKLQWTELRSAVILLAMTLVFLPIVPPDPIGPFGGVSPSRILVMAILLASISFCGYISVKLLGPGKGDVVAGAVGGIVSSTAVTIAFARRSREAAAPMPLAAGAIAATGISFLRTAFLVATLAGSLVAALVPALLTATVAAALYTLMLARGGSAEDPDSTMKNPFDLLAVIKMAVLLVTVAFLARAASELFGDRGLFAASALSGLADVDAVTVTVADMLRRLSPVSAAAAIALAVIANTLAKAAYAFAFGVRGFSAHVWAASAAAIATGALCFFVQQALGLA